MNACPVCRNHCAFSPEQLRHRQGWVTCPHCEATFNVFDTKAGAEQAADRAPLVSESDRMAIASLADDGPHRRSSNEPSSNEPPSPALAAADNPFWIMVKARFIRLATILVAATLLLSALGLGVYIWKDQLTKVDGIGPALNALLHQVKPDITIQAQAEDFSLANLSNTPLDHDRGFRLTIHLTNQAAIALPTPDLCVTLLNSHDEPIAFRLIHLSATDTAIRAHQTLESQIDWVPIHDTHSLMVAFSLSPTEPQCVQDTKVLMSLE